MSQSGELRGEGLPTSVEGGVVLNKMSRLGLIEKVANEPTVSGNKQSHHKAEQSSSGEVHSRSSAWPGHKVNLERARTFKGGREVEQPGSNKR